MTFPKILGLAAVLGVIVLGTALRKPRREALERPFPKFHEILPVPEPRRVEPPVPVAPAPEPPLPPPAARPVPLPPPMPSPAVPPSPARPAEERVCASGGAQARTGPGEAFPEDRAGPLPPEQRVKALEEKDGWLRVRAGARETWVKRTDTVSAAQWDQWSNWQKRWTSQGHKTGGTCPACGAVHEPLPAKPPETPEMP